MLPCPTTAPTGRLRPPARPSAAAGLEWAVGARNSHSSVRASLGGSCGWAGGSRGVPGTGCLQAVVGVRALPRGAGMLPARDSFPETCAHLACLPACLPSTLNHFPRIPAAGGQHLGSRPGAMSFLCKSRDPLRWPQPRSFGTALPIPSLLDSGELCRGNACEGGRWSGVLRTSQTQTSSSNQTASETGVGEQVRATLRQ